MERLGCRWIPQVMFSSEDDLMDIPTAGIGLSDEVLAVGLFANHAGKERNETVVRTGNIAMIPQEPVVTNQRWDPWKSISWSSAPSLA